MVLPSNTILRPGDALQSKPKQAMFIRMSSETLDALQSFPTQPALQFEFGDSPCIYIGDTCFPMRYSKETTQSDLYLRTSSATKKNAPLKLYANVIGKFSVERELVDGLREKIRESTQDAANQRNSRTTVFIDTPPDLPSASGKKRKEPPISMFRKPLRPSDKPKPAPVPVPVNKLPTVQRDAPISPHRKHVLRLLALSKRTEEDIMNSLSTSERTLPSRREIQDLLEQLADFTPPIPGSADKSRGSYCLKHTVWKEVRPYEWTELTEQQRTVVAREARIKFQSLGIPESDPTWDHVRYRSPAANISSSSGQSKASSSVGPEATAVRAKNTHVQKHAVSSKEKKLKMSSDPKAEVKVKQETKATLRSTNADVNPKDTRPRDTLENRKMADSTPVESPVERKQAPVSTKAAKTNVRLSASNDLRASTSAASRAPTERNMERDLGLSTLPPNPNASRLEEKVPTLQKFKKLPRDSGIAESDRDSRSSSHIDRTSTKERTGRREADDDSYDDRKPSQLKRKNAEQDRDRAPNTKSQSTSAKRRKTEGESPVGPARDDRSESGKRLSMDPRMREKANGTLTDSSKSTRTKEETSASKRHPLSNEKIPTASPSSWNTRAVGPQKSKTTSTKKNPRRSPIYTSSEEGGEEDAPLKTRVPTKPSNSAIASSSRRPRNASSRPLPTDHSALRARYDASYLEYLMSLQRLIEQKGKIDRLLKSSDLESVGSLTDSEGDIELLDPEELSQLAIKHKRLEEELEAIQEIFKVTRPV